MCAWRIAVSYTHLDVYKRQALGLSINSVVITQYSDQPSAMLFHNKLVSRGIKTYFHRLTKGYPTEVDPILSDEGYGANPYIETTCPLVVVTAVSYTHLKPV